MFPVAYGVFGSETNENWEWFMKMLHKAIGSPPGLVISTDAGMFPSLLDVLALKQHRKRRKLLNYVLLCNFMCF